MKLPNIEVLRAFFMIRQYIKLTWYNWAVKDELCEPAEAKVLFLTACLFIIVLLPHLWRARFLGCFK